MQHSSIWKYISISLVVIFVAVIAASAYKVQSLQYELSQSKKHFSDEKKFLQERAETQRKLDALEAEKTCVQLRHEAKEKCRSDVDEAKENCRSDVDEVKEKWRLNIDEIKEKYRSDLEADKKKCRLDLGEEKEKCRTDMDRANGQYKEE